MGIIILLISKNSRGDKMYKKALLAVSCALFLTNGCSSNKDKINLASKKVPTIQNSANGSLQRKMIYVINEIRSSGTICSGSTTLLNWNDSLAKAAEAHSKDMALNNFVKHTGSGTKYDVAKKAPGKGSTFIDRIKYFGFPVKKGNLVGENITRLSIKKTQTDDFMSNFKRGMKNIYKDEAHCKILMNPRFNSVGAAMYKSNGSYYFTIDLGEIK